MTDQHRLISALAFALRHKSGIKWPRNTEIETDIAAKAIIAHLELCGIGFTYAPPRPPHSTP